jgi:hypothetical protein
LSGLKAPNVTAWAEASPTSAGPGQPSDKTPLPGLKALNVTAWAEASPTSAGPGQPSHETRKP